MTFIFYFNSQSERNLSQPPTSPGPVTRRWMYFMPTNYFKHEFCDILSCFYCFCSQAARSPSTPMRMDTLLNPQQVLDQLQGGDILRRQLIFLYMTYVLFVTTFFFWSQFSLFGNGGSQSVFRMPPTRTPTKSNTTTDKKITPRKTLVENMATMRSL